MGLPADYHTHTPLCRHATGEPTELATQAVRLGIEELGFSDHNPMPQDDFDDWRMKASELDLYLEKVERARREHPNLSIKVGLEVDYLPGCEDWVRELAQRYPWDYFIGSVHYISRSWAIDNPNQMSEWKTREPFEVWTAYFELLTKAVESKLFDIIGHADLCKKFAFYPKKDCTPLYRGLVQAAARYGVAMELNTAGLRKPCREIYPNPELVRLARAAGVAITFGSDAHAAAEVGLNLAEAMDLARASGYTQCVRFTRRQRELIKF